MLAIIGGLAVGVAGTAGAAGEYNSVVSNNGHMSCEYMVNNQLGSDLPSWQKVLNFLNPFGEVFQPAAGKVYVVLQCAFSPEMRAHLAERPALIERIALGFGHYGWSSPQWGSPNSTSSIVMACATVAKGGVDWFPTLSGDETRIGCTLTSQPGSTWAQYLFATQNYKCLRVAELWTDQGVIRTHPAVYGKATVATFFGAVGVNVYTTPANGDCDANGGYNLGGVIPANWDPGTQPFANLDGCRGLTIKSATDLRTGNTSPDDEIAMTLAAVDPDRPPGVVDVIIQPHEARGRDEPYRWVGHARWPSEPTFTFVVGPEPYTMVTQWVFTISCSDGTSKTLWYDPSGEGGNPDYSAVHPGFDWEGCIADAAEPGLDPDTWIPALMERLRCLVIWTVTPTYGISWHAARFSQAMDDTALGDVRQIATAPSRVLGSMQGAVGTTGTITTGWGVVNLPAVDPGIASKIRLGLSVLIGLWAIRLSVRWLTAATNMRVGNDEHTG